MRTVDNDMIAVRGFLVAAVLLVAAVSASTARAQKLKVGVVQTVVENRLKKNLAKIERFIDEAKERGCRLVVFPENALYWADSSIDNTPDERRKGCRHGRDYCLRNQKNDSEK